MKAVSIRHVAVWRIRLITCVILFAVLVIFGRLYYLQIVKNDYYLARAEGQYVSSVRNVYTRGSIFFTTRDGEKVSAATVRSGYLLVIDPSRLNMDPEKVYEKINEIIPLDRERFLSNVSDSERRYYEAASRLIPESADQIVALGINGVQLYRDQWRFYPADSLASRIVGFVGYGGDEDDRLVGRYGLERYYEDVLTRNQNQLAVNLFAELFSDLGNKSEDVDMNRPGEIITSIEPTVTRMLEKNLYEVHEEWDSSLTGGIIINPNNGQIYAMSAVPNFNLNDRRGKTIADFRNPLVEDVYEMGSIIKAITIAAGLDSGAITADSTYYDSGSLTMDRFTIRNFDGRGRGTVDMQEVLSQSLNTGVSHIVAKMGKDTFRNYMFSLKLGNETGIDLPNEVHGLVSNLNSPRDIEYATASFGQGVAFTPIDTVRALSALANGGRLITPHLVTSIEYENGTVRQTRFPEGDRVFSEETSEEISRMLTRVVDEALRQGKVKLDNYSVGAKTGTAQIAHPQGGYYDDRFLHTFFGYFPSYDPQFLILLYTKEPKNVRYASETLTDAFMSMTKFLINYYNIPPDR